MPGHALSAVVDAVVDGPGLGLQFARSYPVALAQRFELGPLGRGWSHNWQWSLARSPDGTVTILGPGGARSIFQPDSRGGYFSPAGDGGKLSAAGGGYVLREVDGIRYAFAADGRLDYVEDANGNRITAGYQDGRLTSLTRSSGPTLQIAYNAAGRIASIMDAQGRHTLFTYDTAGEHLISVEAYDGRVTTYGYIPDKGSASQHALSEIVYPGGIVRHFNYDARGRVGKVSVAGGTEEVTYGYGLGGEVMIRNAAGGLSRVYFNEYAEVVKVVDALGQAYSLTFDPVANATQLTDPAGRPRSVALDALDNPLRQTDALGGVTSSVYGGPFGELTSVTDANGNTTKYTYDSRGNLVSVTYADGSRESWTHDAAGQAVTWTSCRGQTVQFTYDNGGQLTSKRFPNGMEFTYTYDPRGNLIAAADPGGTTSLVYYPDDRLQRITYPGGQHVEYAYDAAGRRASWTDELGNGQTYHYDTLGRLERVIDQGGETIARYVYDFAGRVVRKELGNGVYSTCDFDAAGQLLHSVNYRPDATVLARFDYSYDDRGRRTAMATLDGAWSYEYDDVGRLIHAVFASINVAIAGQDLAYFYDAVGNRTRTIVNGITTDYQVNSRNQYVRIGATDYVYDADGNLVRQSSSGSTVDYAYCYLNRLIGASSPSGTWQGAYDALGNRSMTNDNRTVRRYVTDIDGHLRGEYSASGSLVASYTYGLSLLSRDESAADTAYYTFDGLGNTSELTDAAGKLAGSYTYDPFGTLVRDSSSMANPFRFAGQWGVMSDRSDRLFMGARTYLPSLGRFTSPDPLGIDAGDTNFYAYVGNEPTDWIDPSGLQRQCKVVRKVPQICIDALRPPKGHKVLGCTVTNRKTGETTVYLDPAQDADVEVHETVHCWQHTQQRQMTCRQRELEAYGAQCAYGIIMGLPGAADACSVVALIHANKNPARWGCRPSKRGSKPTRRPGPSGVIQPVAASDPNQKLGPGGFGVDQFVAAGQSLSYRVDFENDAKATAPAQYVSVVDQLDSDLDSSTFELTEVGFADHVLAVPRGSQYFQTTMPVTYDGRGFEVQIQIGIDLSAGKVRAQFMSIDPATGLPPDVLTGFLPPEDGTGRGMGYFTYIVQPKAGLPTGTEVRNIAVIQFDFGEIIATNQIDPHDPSKGTDPAKECLNTIDSGLPSSRVLPLFPVVWDDQFRVSWAGEDDIGGSGVASYDIYVSDNGGPYTLWLDHTTATSADFTGQPKHAYAFYSVARDNVGNVELAPTDHDAITYMEGALRGTGGDDAIHIVQDGDQPGNVLVFINNEGTHPSYGASLTSLEKAVILGGGGNDTLIVDFVNGSPVPTGGISFDGGEGENVLRLAGLTASYSVTIGETAVDVGGAAIGFAAAQVELAGPAGGVIALESLSLTGSAQAALTSGGAKVLRTSGMSIPQSATLDLTDNDMIVTATEATRAAVYQNVFTWLKAGRVDGAWTGKGLTSSEAARQAAKHKPYTGLASMINDKGSGEGAWYTKFDGVTVTINDILVKYTWNGDANLDGVVNADDYFRVDTGFITQAGGYQNGDLNYDGVVNADDYFLIDSAFLGQTGPLATTPRPIETPVGDAAEASDEDTLVLRASQPNAGVFATREGNWLRDLLGSEESVLGAAE